MPNKDLARLAADFGSDRAFLSFIGWDGSMSVITEIKRGSRIPNELIFRIIQTVPVSLSRDLIQKWWQSHLDPHGHTLWQLTAVDPQDEPYKGILQWIPTMSPEQQDTIRDAITLSRTHPHTNPAVQNYINLIVSEIDNHTQPPFSK